jgi:outer membrane protein OmpA-like peptidoglycan-associated protein
MAAIHAEEAAEAQSPEVQESLQQKCGVLRERLDKAVSSYEKHGAVTDLDLVPKAFARLSATERHLAKMGEEKSREVFVACSALVEAGVVELALARSTLRAARLQENLVKTLGKLNDTHEAILNIERSRASELKADLDAEKDKAARLRAEAQRKFDELQSALIQVTKDARGTIISMSDILFDVNKASLKPELKTNLAKIAGILTVFKGPKVIVEGHTDNQGAAEYNQKLSEERATNVMNFLVEQGVGAGRLTAVGYGLTRPVADNSTKEGRQKNRRVDLVIQDTAKQQVEESDW